MKVKLELQNCIYSILVGEKREQDESSDEEELECIKYRRTYKDYVNQKGERHSPVAAADYHAKLNILAVGHESGAFAIWEINWALDASEDGSMIVSYSSFSSIINIK